MAAIRPAILNRRHLPLPAPGSLGPLLAVMLLGSLLRAYDLQPIGWVPDHYDRLIEAEALIHGRPPDSVIYPPGGSIVLAIPVALFGASVSTMQWTAVAFSLALMPLVYSFVVRTTADRRAALILATACAISSPIVVTARFGYPDSAALLLIMLAFWLIPNLKNADMKAYGGFGLMMALLFCLRPTNVFVVPSLGLYWLAQSISAWTPGEVRRAILSRQVVAACIAFSVPAGLAVVTGRWSNGGYGGLLTVQEFFPNLGAYWLHLLLGEAGALFLLPLIFAGSVRLWRANRSLALAVMSLLVIWPVVHSPFLFISARYVAPAQVALLLLASLGASSLMRSGDRDTRHVWTSGRAWGVACSSMIAVLLSVSAVLEIGEWDTKAAESDAGLSSEMRPIVEDLPHGALLISGVTRAFSRTAPQLDYVDLFNHAASYAERDDAVADLDGRIRTALADGKSVYYLYSHLDTGSRDLGGVWSRFTRYFPYLSGEFEMTEVFSPRHLRSGFERWTLYRVTQKTAGAEPSSSADKYPD